MIIERTLSLNLYRRRTKNIWPAGNGGAGIKSDARNWGKARVEERERERETESETERIIVRMNDRIKEFRC